MPWVNAQVAHLLSVQRAVAMVEDDQTAGNSNLGGYNEIVLTKNTETIDAFSSCVITAKASTAHTSKRINVMSSGSMHRQQFSTPGPNGTKCLYQAEKGEQKCDHGSEKQHGLSPDPKEEDPSSKGS